MFSKKIEKNNQENEETDHTCIPGFPGFEKGWLLFRN
jgi:hypothetical protein